MRLFSFAILCVFAGFFAMSLPGQTQEISADDLILPPATTARDSSEFAVKEKRFSIEEASKPLAEVNGYIITRAEAARYPGGVDEAIGEAVLRQAYEQQVPIYGEPFLESFRLSLRQHVTELYFDYILERFIVEEGLDRDYQEWLEAYKDTLQADFPVYLILRWSEPDAYALINWVKKGYEFRETMREYSELYELLDTSPLSGKFRDKIIELRIRLQKELKPGDITEKPIKVPFGYVIGYKSPFEKAFDQRILKIRQQYFASFRESVRKRLVSGLFQKFQAQYQEIPTLDDFTLDLTPDEESEEYAWIPEDRAQFNVTRGDVAHTFINTYFNVFGIPPEQVLEDAYIRSIQEMVVYNEARGMFNEASPEVQSRIDDVTANIRETLFLDQEIRKMPGYSDFIIDKYGEIKSNFEPLTVLKVQELSAPSVTKVSELLVKWINGESFEDLQEQAFSSLDMTDPFTTSYIVVGQNSQGNMYYLFQDDLERFGTELLRMKVEDISSSPVFHSGQWAIYKLKEKREGRLPKRESIEPIILRALHADLRQDVINKYIEAAQITRFDKPAKKEEPEKKKVIFN